MKNVLLGFLYFLLSVIVAAGIFALVVFIAKSVNDVSFYEQLIRWFGRESAIGLFLNK